MTGPDRRDLAAVLCSVLARTESGCDALTLQTGPPPVCHQQADAMLAAGYRVSRLALWGATVRGAARAFWQGFDEADSPPHYGRPPLDS